MQADVDFLLSQLSIEVGVPLVLMDLTYTVRGFTPDRIDGDPTRAGVILRGRPRSDVRERLNAAGAHDATSPIRTPKIAGTSGRVLLPLRRGHTLVGFVSWLDNDDEPTMQRAEHSEYTQALAHALSSASQPTRIHAATVQLITGRPLTFEQIALLHADTFDTGAKFSALCIRLDGTVAVDLRSLLSGNLNVHLNGVEAVIVAEHTALDEWKNIAGMAVGVGPALSPMELAYSWKLAVFASRIAARGDTMHGRWVEWEQLGIEQTFERLSLEELTISGLPESLQTLLTDRRGPDLADTLLAYLDRGGDAAGVAVSRGIARSTVYQRLERAEKLTTTKLSDGATRLDLHAGLRLAQMMGLLE